jgi:hypothetical protein
MARKSKQLNPIIGIWHIVSMSAWEDDYLDEEVQAFIEFDDKGGGAFHFGRVRGFMDHYRTKKRDGKRAAQFSWHGEDGADGTPLEGIGWAVLEGDKLAGMFCIDEGDDWEFVAIERQRRPRSRSELGMANDEDA